MIVSTNLDTYIIYNVYNTHYLLFNKKKNVSVLSWLFDVINQKRFVAERTERLCYYYNA